MAAQAVMMIDTGKNLEAATDVLVRTNQHKEFINDPAYRSLLDASKGLTASMSKLRRSYLTLLMSLVLTQSLQALITEGVQTREQVDLLRKLYDDMTELCYGNANKGVRGWRECWNEVFGFNEQQNGLQASATMQ